MMPIMAGGFFAAAVYRFSKGCEFEQSLYGGFALLMCSGMLRALEGFVQHAADKYVRVEETTEPSHCSIGELAQLYNSENHINADLHVIKMKNWHRNYFFESTGSRWIPPSPNLRT